MKNFILALSIIGIFSSCFFPNNAKGALANKELDLTGIGQKAYYGDVCGDMVVYSTGPACDFTWDIKSKNLKTGEVAAYDGINKGGLDNQPKIDGAILVWSGGPKWKKPWTHEPSNFSIFARNITTGIQKTLREYTMSESYSHPAISGNKVVWIEHLELDTTPKGKKGKNWWNTPYNICGADITDMENPVYFTISKNVGKRDPYPCLSYWKSFDNVIDISNDTVVWEADGNIYGADISDLNQIELFTICDDPDGQYNPVISDEIVAWTDLRNDSGDIYGASILDMKDIQSVPIVRRAGKQRQPAIDGDMIVYVSSWGISPSDYGDIRMCRITDFPRSVEIKLKKKYYGQIPAINGNLIVWKGKGKETSTEGISIDRKSIGSKPAKNRKCEMD